MRPTPGADRWDQFNPALNGNTPRHQANLIFQAAPTVSTDRFAVGAVFIGTTDTYAQDVSATIPGYVTTSALAQSGWSTGCNR